jgi:hypothetical protein
MQPVVERHDGLVDFLLEQQSLLRARLLLLLLPVGTDVHEELRNLVRVLARRWHFDRTCPVKVEVAQRVGQQLEVRAAQSGLVHRHIEVGRQHAPLSRRRRREEEVELLTVRGMLFDESLVDDAARGRIQQPAFRVLDEEALRDPFVDHDHCDVRLGGALVVEQLNSLLELGHLRGQNLVALSVANPISVNHEVSRELVVVVCSESVDSLKD